MDRQSPDRVNLAAGAVLVVALGAVLFMVGSIAYHNFGSTSQTVSTPKAKKSKKAKNRAKAKRDTLSKLGRKGKGKGKKRTGKRKAKRKAALAEMTAPGPIEQGLEKIIRRKDSDVRMGDLNRHMEQLNYEPFQEGQTPFTDDKDFQMLMKTWSNPDSPDDEAFVITVFHRRRLVALVHTGRIRVRGEQPKPVGTTAWMTPVGTLKAKKRKRLNMFLKDVVEPEY